MLNRIVSFVFAGLVLASCSKKDTLAPAEAENCTVGRSVRDGEIIRGQYIVAYKAASDLRVASAGSVARMSSTVLQRHNIEESSLLASFPGEVSGFVAKLTDEQVRSLQADSRVSIVEPDRIIALGACFKVVDPTRITWNVNKVGYGDGRGKTAWVIDTGIDLNHPDLNVDSARSRSFLPNIPSADDENGHGTHVAGIIGAKNNEIGTLGVASNATLVSLRVLNKEGEGTLSSIIQALSYVNSNAKAGDVVNMSLGEETVSEVLDQAVLNTSSRGILIAMAAGNDSKPAIQFSPGRANGTNLFTVSAVDSLDTFASFSNYGNDAVDYAAPGVRIVSTWTDGRYARLSGTSMATPHVAGLLLINGRNLKSSGTAKNDPDGTPDLIVSK
jgi:hypothetical protein